MEEGHAVASGTKIKKRQLESVTTQPPAFDSVATWCVWFICNHAVKVKSNVIIIATPRKSPTADFRAACSPTPVLPPPPYFVSSEDHS